ncbi:flavin reductase [Sedimentibacter sp. MB31-C6]|uniref:flavin reductase n=1 Tax=Sedimentibacter sp. MB31-C6 TaxID=3109366 RepID=UPI002DDD5E0B|nr:flavin reductase [Sedimentibacter sp. MB36-C1]WSI03652.1 flavin reductase [Sedimentibacter sp. MB36-C1]
MDNFREIKPEYLDKNVFHLINDEWMLITAEKDNKVNTMTASWGGFGIMWNKKVTNIVVRPQRYTKEFIDSSETYSLCFFDKEYKKTMAYLGSVSGRDEEKIEKSNLTVNYIDDTPYFKEANMVIICKKLYAQKMKPECFIMTELDNINYPIKDYHTLYISEIDKIYVKEENN